MKVLVIGGAGYIGSVTANLIAAAGHDVTVVDNLVTGKREFLQSNITFHHLDATDEEALYQLMKTEGFTAVINLAALIKVGESTEQPGRYFKNNLNIINSTLSAMSRTGTKHFLFSSSGSVYGNGAEPPIKEDVPLAPESVYAETKATGEKIISWYSRLGLINSVIFRYFNAAGASGKSGMVPPLSHIIPIISEVAAGKRDELVIFGDDYPTKDGTCIRDYVHVEDIARAHLLAIEKMAAGEISNEVFNLGRGEGVSILDIIKEYSRCLGIDINYRVGPRRPANADAHAQYADTMKAFKKLGWEPVKSLGDIVTSDFLFRR